MKNSHYKKTTLYCPECGLQTIAIFGNIMRCLSSRNCIYSEKISDIAGLKKEVVVEEMGIIKEGVR